MKDFFDIFLHYMFLRMVSGNYLPKHVFKAVEKSAIFIALMVMRASRQDPIHKEGQVSKPVYDVADFGSMKVLRQNHWSKS